MRCKAVKDYTADGWAEVLKVNGLRSFEDIWALDADWFEAPNQRRGGWSGVSRLELNNPGGGLLPVFLKRQQNHTYRSLLHPLRGEQTFVREMRNIHRYLRQGVPALEPLYFAQRTVGGDRQAIVITRELSGFVSLEELAAKGLPRGRARRHLLHAVAEVLRKLHLHRLQHNCLYPKHLYVRPGGDGDFDVRLIDLEKTKWRPFRRLAMLRDLDTLNRRSRGWSRTDRLRFLLYYLDEQAVTSGVRRVWSQLARLASRKNPAGNGPGGA